MPENLLQVKFKAAQMLGGNWEPYPIDMSFQPPCMVLSTIGLAQPGKIQRVDCFSHNLQRSLQFFLNSCIMSVPPASPSSFPLAWVRWQQMQLAGSAAALVPADMCVQESISAQCTPLTHAHLCVVL